MKKINHLFTGAGSIAFFSFLYHQATSNHYAKDIRSFGDSTMSK